MTTLVSGLALARRSAGPSGAVDTMVTAYLKQGMDVGHLEAARAWRSPPSVARSGRRLPDRLAAAATSGLTDKPPLSTAVSSPAAPKACRRRSPWRRGITAGRAAAGACRVHLGRSAARRFEAVAPPESFRWTDAFLVAPE
jgi:hypothetical protein